MEYQIFARTVKDALQAAAGDDANVVTAKLTKVNDNSAEVISIYTSRSNVSPAIRMDWLYQMYKDGDSIENIVNATLKFISRHKPKNYDISFFFDYSLVRDRVVFRLINYSANMEMMESVPHKRFLDLAVVYYYLFEDDIFGENRCALIKNSHLETWGIGMDVLDIDAMENAMRLLPYRLRSIHEIIDGVMGSGIKYTGKIPRVFFLSNTDFYFGASALLYPGMQKRISGMLGGDYYMLPINVHECLVIPCTEDFAPEDLKQMVYEVNTDNVALEDILGYSVYLYDSKEDRLVMTAMDIWL